MFRINRAEFGALKARTFSEVGSSTVYSAKNSGIVCRKSTTEIGIKKEV